MVGILYFLILFLFIGIQLFVWWISPRQLRQQKQNNETNSSSDEYPPVTILVPARDEEKSIGRCLESLTHQNYPSSYLQIIVINDHSMDQTVQVTGAYPGVGIVDQIDGLRGKKAAIQKGIEMATGEVILTIDADCEVGEDWVTSMVATIGRDSSVLVTGPVWMVPDKPVFIQKYQEIEQAALNVLTCGGVKSGLILSASGANMAYPKSLYFELDPYSDNQHVPSGDDVFFAQKVNQSGGDVRFARQREAMVYTSPAASFSQFIRQRLRWAGKSSGYTHWPTKLYMAGFGVVNLSFTVLLIAGIWYPVFYTYLFYGLVLKFIADYLIIHTGMRWGNRPVCWQDILKASLFQVVYVVYVAVLLVVGRKEEWKG